MKQLAIAMILFALLATGLRVRAADAEPGKSVDKKLPLAGQVFLVDGHTAFLILPKERPAGRPTPWVWYAPTLPNLPGPEEQWMFEKFLAAGIAIGGIDAGESYGSPKGCAVFTAFYQELVGKRGMSPQPCLLARSRGGLMLYNWAAENPGSVAGIAGIYPVCNLNSYPGMAKACGAYGLTAAELTGQLVRYNPIDRLAPLAKAKVPVFHIHGDADVLVSLKENSGELAKRYRDLGGPIELQVAPGQGHNMWTGFFQCNDLVQFVIKHATTPKTADTMPAAIQVIPKPRQLQPAPGEYLLTPKTVIRIQSPELQEIGGYLAATVKAATGLQLAVGPAAADGIVLKLDPARQDLGDEGYALVCNAQGVTITAPKPAGVFYGIQTLRQLLPLRDEAAPPANPAWSVPCVTIVDWPRFPWRGYLLDTVRHFRTKEEVKRTIDLLAFQKLNRLHLHLTDNEGWRVEIKKYPKLIEVGARQKNCSGKAGEGWFYTQADIRELVAYAASRQVTLVPEIEMPGHSRAALAAYPELGCGGKLSQSLCVTRAATLEFSKDVLAEVIELFPSPLIHIGADEVLPEPWRGCPECGPRMKALAGQALPADVSLFNVKVNNNSGVPFHADIARLQGEFVREIDQFLQSKGRRLIGWDEILDGGLKNDSRAAAMAWRSDGAVAGAIAGNRDVVAALYPRFYLDNNTPLQITYSVEPVSKEMTAAQAAHVLGVQGNMWGEGTPTIQHVDRRTFPRLCAIAEIGWSAAEPRDFADFKIRLDPFMRRLEAQGVTPGAWPSAGYKRVSLTTGKPATCSAADPGMEARLANDGVIDTESYWATDVTPGKDAWWQVDLEKPTTVGRVIVIGYYGDTRYYGFTVEGSADGKAWIQLADRRANTAISTRTGYECTFKPVEIRYLRVTMTGNSVNLGRHLVEVMAFEK